MSKAKSKMSAIDTKKIVANLQEQFGYKNHLQVPRLLKVVVTMGVKDALVDSKAIYSLLLVKSQ
jgi:large subunit ribosomal protein L5